MSQVESSCVKLSQVESSWVKSCIVYFVIALIFHFIAHCLDYRIHKYFAAQRVSIWSIRAPKQPKLNARRETEGSVKFLVLVGGTQKLNWEWQTQQKKNWIARLENIILITIFFLVKKKNCFCFSHLIFRDFFAYLLRIH